MATNDVRKDFLGLLAWYVIAYLLYWHVVGIPFLPFSPEAQTGIRTVCYSDLANVWLRNNLLESVWYLHARPPLSSLLWGLLLKVSPAYCVLVYYVIQFVAGALAVCLLYATMARLNTGRLPRLIACLALATLPDMFVHQTSLYTTHMEFCLFAAAVYFLSAFYVQPGRSGNLVGLFCAFAVLALLRSQWHLAVLLSVTVLMALMENTALRKRIAILSLIFVIPVCAWYTKNQMVFGFWGASSWMGSSMSQTALRVFVRYLPLSEAKEMKAGRQISEDFPAMFESHRVLRRVPPGTIPSYESECLSPYFPGHEGDIRYFNFNYIGMIDSSLQDLRDSRTVIAKHPFLYARGGMERVWEVSWTPSVSYGMTFGMQLTAYAAAGTYVFCLLVPVMVLVAVLTFRTEVDNGSCKFVVLTFFFAAGMLFISCACNGSEQERMRWGQAPVYFIYAALLMDILRRKWLSVRRPWRSADRSSCAV